MKKVNGDMAPDHYQGRIPEYTTMSRRPGIAKNWVDKYHATDVAHDDQVILNGKAFRPPRYYDQQFEIADPDAWLKIKAARIRKGKEKPEEKTPARRKVKAKIRDQKLKQLKRKLDDD